MMRLFGLSCVAFLLIVTAPRQLSAQAPSIFMLPVHVTFAITGNTAKWEIDVPNIAQRLPILQPGDVVTVALAPLPSNASFLGKWARPYRCYSHETCRRSFFKKKCTRHYETADRSTPMRAPYVQHPFDPAFDFTAMLIREGGDATPVRSIPMRDKSNPIQLGEITGPRDLVLSGGMSVSLPVNFTPGCNTPVGPRKRVYARGAPPEQWFALEVTIQPAPMFE